MRSLFASFSRESAKYLHVETCEKFCTFLDGLQSLLKQSPTFSDIWYRKFPILLCLKSDFFHKNANISKNNQKKYFLEPLHEIGFYHFFFFFRKAYKASEVVAQMCSVKKVVSKISQNSQKRTSAKVSFLIILQAAACNFIKKETLAQVFSCEYCKIIMSTFFWNTSGDCF